MSVTIYGAQKIVDDFTGVTPYTWPGLYLSLHTANPTEAGLHTFEVSASGYARFPLLGVMGAADSSGISVNTSVITIGPAGADWGVITYLGIEDALVSGNMIIPGVPQTPRTIVTGQPFQIPIGRLRLRMPPNQT